MTETPSPVFYATAKSEQPKPLQKEDSKLVAGVKNAVNKWLERIGPKSIENHFIKAHEKVLSTLNSDQRKEVFAKEAEKWQTAGKRWGVAATVIDTSLMSIGAGLAFAGMQNPEIGTGLYSVFTTYLVNRAPQNPIFHAAYDILMKPIDAGRQGDDYLRVKQNKINSVGRTVAAVPILASLGILVGSGPGHWLAHLAAGGKEQIGKMKARTNNYVDSGKAAEHASKVGNAIGKAATETAKYVAEHPDEIRKTVETVNRVKRQNAESAQKLKETQQKTAEVKLEADYQDWIAHHPDKVYYEQSGQPMPSKADYVEIKAREEAAKQAAREEEKRGEAK